jgi:hypothetical protein
MADILNIEVTVKNHFLIKSFLKQKIEFLYNNLKILSLLFIAMKSFITYTLHQKYNKGTMEEEKWVGNVALTSEFRIHNILSLENLKEI